MKFFAMAASSVPCRPWWGSARGFVQTGAACYYAISPLRDPLLAPLAAIAAGILVSRFVPFEIRELLSVIAALFLLTILSLRRHSRVLAGICCLLGLAFAGS